MFLKKASEIELLDSIKAYSFALDHMEDIREDKYKQKAMEHLIEAANCLDEEGFEKQAYLITSFLEKLAGKKHRHKQHQDKSNPDFMCMICHHKKVGEERLHYDPYTCSTCNSVVTKSSLGNKSPQHVKICPFCSKNLKCKTCHEEFKEFGMEPQDWEGMVAAEASKTHSQSPPKSPKKKHIERPITLCPHCGREQNWKGKCPECDTLEGKSFTKKCLKCHHQWEEKFKEHQDTKCPECGSDAIGSISTPKFSIPSESTKAEKIKKWKELGVESTNPNWYRAENWYKDRDYEDIWHNKYFPDIMVDFTEMKMVIKTGRFDWSSSYSAGESKVPTPSSGQKPWEAPKAPGKAVPIKKEIKDSGESLGKELEEGEDGIWRIVDK